MVECGALEKRCASKRRTGSSNLPPSAYSPQAPPPWRRPGPWRAAPYQRPLTPLSGYHYRIAPIPQGLWPLQCGFCGTGASCGASSQFLAQPCGFASVSETVSGVKPLTGVRIPPSVSAGCEIVARLTSASRLVVATVFGPARPGAQSVCDWCRTWPAEPMLISRDRTGSVPTQSDGPVTRGPISRRRRIAKWERNCRWSLATNPGAGS